MAQTGFMLSDEGRSITVLNDSGTTAITAGDICFSAANTDVLGATAAAARNSYAAGDVKVKSIEASATGYQTPVGVALEDIPVDGYGAVAMEGVFITQAQAAIAAGAPVRGTAAADNELVALETATTTVTATVANNKKYKIGRALTGASTDGKFIIWKLTL